MRPPSEGLNKKLLAMREGSGLTQVAFYRRVGSTQSAGSRYEKGRGLPYSLRLALCLAYLPTERAQAIYDKIREGKVPALPL